MIRIPMLSTHSGGMASSGVVPPSFPSPFSLAFASQLGQHNPFHHLASLQQQLNSLAQSASSSPCQSTSSTPSSMRVMRKPRMGGTTMKTAKVWKYFDQLPSEEQAAECQLCRKKIKATNSSTTGMIRHLRSCHVNEYAQLQEARQNSLIVKMASETDDKSRLAFLKEMQGGGSTPIPIGGSDGNSSKYRSPQLSPHSASDSGVSDASSSSTTQLRPSSPLSIMALLRQLPPGLPAPKAILPTAATTGTTTGIVGMQQRACKVESEEDQMEKSIDSSRSLGATFFNTRKSVVDTVEERRINTQIALMLLLDSCPSSIVDRPGFRGLIKMLLPSHPLPMAAQFDTDIIPDVIARLKADLGTPFAINNPSDTLTSTPLLSSLNTTGEIKVDDSPSKDSTHSSSMGSASAAAGGGGAAAAAAAMAAASDISRSFGHSIELKREEDSDSSSSADSEPALPARIDSFLNFIGRYVFPHEELIALLSLCRAWTLHFEDSKEAQSLASLSLPPLQPALPDLARDISFVANNVEKINAYAKGHPELHLMPITDAQTQFVRDLYAHIIAI